MVNNKIDSNHFKKKWRSSYAVHYQVSKA